MTTSSYLEYILTILGWVVNNGLWDVLTGTGLFALPLGFKIIGIWIKTREEGDDEGNKGILSARRMEHAIYGAFIVIIACCVPTQTVSLTTLTFDTTRAKQCGFWTPVKPGDSGYGSVVSTMSGMTASAPVWWAFMHMISKGVTQAAVASLPCRPDLRQVRFDVQHTQITNPALAQELQDFTSDCYSQAFALWKRQDAGRTTDIDVLRDIEWLGSKIFLKDFYPQLHSKLPRSAFPWSQSRDDGYANTGQGGYPTCSEWWSQNKTGLKSRVLDTVNTTTMTRMAAAFKGMVSKEEYTEALIRRLVSPTSLSVSQNGRTYAGYGGNADFTLDNAVNRMASVLGTSVGALGAFPAFDAMRQALPMVQALLLMAMYVLIPLVLVFGTYEYKTVVTLTFVTFGMHFLTFWWELARWLDSWLLEIMYGSDSYSRWNVAGFQNSADDLIMNFVMGTMFLVLPAVWMGALSWAGVRIGGVVESAMVSGSKRAQDAGGKAGGIADKALSGMK